MTALVRLYGNSPRVRVVEALLRLSPIQSFSIPNASREAGVNRSRTAEILRELEEMGMVTKTRDGWGEQFKANKASPWFQVASYSDSALEAVEEMASDTGEVAKTVEGFRIKMKEVADGLPRSENGEGRPYRFVEVSADTSSPIEGPTSTSGDELEVPA